MWTLRVGNLSVGHDALGSGRINRRAYLTRFVWVAMAHSGPRKLTLAAFICNSDDTENYVRHANLV